MNTYGSGKFIDIFVFIEAETILELQALLRQKKFQCYFFSKQQNYVRIAQYKEDIDPEFVYYTSDVVHPSDHTVRVTKTVLDQLRLMPAASIVPFLIDRVS